jgi:hypothetical protein
MGREDSKKGKERSLPSCPFNLHDSRSKWLNDMNRDHNKYV